MPQPTTDEYFRQQLMTASKRMQKFLELGAPNVILASELVILWTLGLGLCGQDVMKEWGEKLIKESKRGSGYCPGVGCENTIDSKETFLPYCEACEVKEQQRVDEIEKRLREGDGGL